LEQAPAALTDEQTAFDYVVLVMEERIGDVVGYPGYRTNDDDWNGGAYWCTSAIPVSWRAVSVRRSRATG
jgi:hypothetical protein